MPGIGQVRLTDQFKLNTLRCNLFSTARCQVAVVDAAQ
jgi:hypothetical protein